MAFCRTRTGALRLVYEGQEYLLTANGLELPDALAEDIRPHVNVIVEDRKPTPPEPEVRKKAPRGE